ncbi:MAG: ATP-binding cassette domain-containing protein [Enterocloster sp.]
MKRDRILEIRHLSKTFGTNPVLKDIDFSVSSGDVTCIIGASGSGKSTLLRCLNLLETPTTGEDRVPWQPILRMQKVNARQYRSKVGMVFQSFNLFNNMTVLDELCVIGQVKSCLRRTKTDAQKNAHVLPGKGWDGSLYQCQAEAALRRTETEGGHCQGIGHGA